MRVKQNANSGHTIRFALFFFAFIFLIIIGSFVIKGFTLIRTSLFDGKHLFTVVMQLNNKPGYVLFSFLPKEEAISVLQVEGKQVEIKKLQVLLGIPIDAYILDKNSSLFKKSEVHTLLPLLLKDIMFRFDKTKTNMTLLDIVRLWMFVKKVPQYNILEKEYDFSKNENPQQDNSEIDALVNSLFIDSTIVEEKKSIHIINASGRVGLGNRIARIITNSGGNVIAVTTGDSILPISEIAYFEEKSYTVSKLETLLQSKSILTNKQAISDIVIIVGKDRADLFSIEP